MFGVYITSSRRFCQGLYQAARQAPHRSGPAEFSSCHYFIAHKMETDDPWCLCWIFEITIHGVTHHGPEFIKGFALSRDTPPQGRGAVSPFFCLRDFKNDLGLHASQRGLPEVACQKRRVTVSCGLFESGRQSPQPRFLVPRSALRCTKEERRLKSSGCHRLLPAPGSDQIS